MTKETEGISNDQGTLVQAARALLAATDDVAGEEVSNARKRVAAALERGKQLYGTVREKAAEGAHATDEAVLEHPYQAIGIAFGVGALISYLVSRRWCRNGD